MKCSKCGKELEIYAKLCNECVKKESRKRVIIIIVTCFIIIGVAISLFLLDEIVNTKTEDQKYGHINIDKYVINNNFHNEVKPYFINNYRCSNSNEDYKSYNLSIGEDDTYVFSDSEGNEYSKGKYNISFASSSDINDRLNSYIHWYTINIEEETASTFLGSKFYIGSETDSRYAIKVKVKINKDIYNCSIA